MVEEIICQECKEPILQETAVKVSGEGFMCNGCVEKLIRGEDNEN